MHNYGVILVNIMQRNALGYREVSKKIGRSLGWINSVAKGKRELSQEEFQEILTQLEIKNDPKRFSGWVASNQRLTQKRTKSFDGAILKFLRLKKRFSLEKTSSELKISVSYLSKLENGQKAVSKATRDRLLNIYGYSPSSFKNFNTKDKRALSIPPIFKLNILLQGMNQAQLMKLLEFATKLTQEN